MAKRPGSRVSSQRRAIKPRHWGPVSGGPWRGTGAFRTKRQGAGHDAWQWWLLLPQPRVCYMKGLEETRNRLKADDAAVIAELSVYPAEDSAAAWPVLVMVMMMMM